MRQKKVFVTGGTGFIGNRLIEVLVNTHNIEVVALIRNYSQAARLARMSQQKVQLVKADISDREALIEATRDCDTIYHLAFDPTGLQPNIDGANNILKAVKTNNIARLVHVSSISVFEPLPEGGMDETAPAEPIGQFYADAKLAVENRVLKRSRELATSTVVVQPTIVYGPFSKPWTDGPVSQLSSGGKGLCNAVYVDDVVSGMICAAEAEGCDNKCYLISAEEPTTWGTFFEKLQEPLNVEAIRFMPRDEIEKQIKSVSGNAKLLIADPKRIFKITPIRKLGMIVKDLLNESAKDVLKSLYGKYRRVAPSPVYMPDQLKLELYDSKAIVDISRARKDLGYSPRYDIERGMAITQQYVHWLTQSQKADL